MTLRYKDVTALDIPRMELPAGIVVGLIGPDGVGKSSLLSARGGRSRDARRAASRCSAATCATAVTVATVCPRIAYMPQGLGKNLYPTLSVFENVDFFGAPVRACRRPSARRRIGELLEATGLAAFADRPAGKLSGGMKQKLGLCCALIHDPDLLDPRRADDRRRSALAAPVLGTRSTASAPAAPA